MSVIDGTPKLESITPPARRSLWRLGIAFALGAAAALSAFLLGIPGNGEFVATIWLAAFVGLLITPGWPGFVALIAGVAVGAVLIDASDGVFGLVFLIVAIVSAVAAHGALCASVLLRVRTLGWRTGLRDARVLVGGGLVLGTVLIFVWFANEFARNPP